MKPVSDKRDSGEMGRELSRRYVEKELKRLDQVKADDKEFQMVKEIVEEAKKLAISAREKALSPHVCNQTITLDNLRAAANKIEAEISNGKKLKTSGFAALIVAIATAGVFLGVMKSSIKETQDDVVEVKATVQENTEKINELKKTVDENQREDRKADDNNFVRLEKIVEKAIRQVSKRRK